MNTKLACPLILAMFGTMVLGFTYSMVKYPLTEEQVYLLFSYLGFGVPTVSWVISCAMWSTDRLVTISNKLLHTNGFLLSEVVSLHVDLAEAKMKADQSNWS